MSVQAHIPCAALHIVRRRTPISTFATDDTDDPSGRIFRLRPVRLHITYTFIAGVLWGGWFEQRVEKFVEQSVWIISFGTRCVRMAESLCSSCSPCPNRTDDGGNCVIHIISHCSGKIPTWKKCEFVRLSVQSERESFVNRGRIKIYIGNQF